MRASLEHIAQISAYLSGELTAEQRATFESSLAGNPELQQQLSFQQQLIKAVERTALRQQIEAAARQSGGSGSSGTSWKFLTIIGFIVLTGLGAFALLSPKASEQPQSAPKQQAAAQQPQTISTTTILSDSTTTAAPFKTVINHGMVSTDDLFEPAEAEWQPWVPFKRQYYSFDAAKGSTIEGKDGTLIIVPKNAFLDAAGNPVTGQVDLELIEAITFADMIAYNLTTMSDGKALSSGGMLHIEARAGGQEVTINPDRPLYIEIPTDTYYPDMMAWKGEQNGETLNWTAPQPLKKFLVMVDLDQLDFLPEGFANKVTTCLPYHGHQTNSNRLTDSLYYALGSMQSLNTPQPEKSVASKAIIGSATTHPEQAPSPEIPAGNTTVSDTSDEDRANEIPINVPSLKGGKSVFRGGIGELFDPAGNRLGGVQVFLSGPNPVTSNGEGRFMVDELSLSREVLTFVRPGFDTLRISNLKFKPKKVTTITLDFKPSKQEKRCFIDPAGIRAIRTEKFQQTFIATKEFEERLRYMHKLERGQEIFDLYVNNLSKDLSAVDAMAAQLLTGSEKATFEAFSKQGLTNVKEAPLYDDQLSAYYNEKRAAFARETAEVKRAYDQKNLAELNKLQQDWNATFASYPVDGVAFSAGTSGRSKTPGRINRLPRASVANTQTYATQWFSTGWVNIDCYLHALLKGDPTIVNIQAQSPTGKVYQCLDLLQTIVPITLANGKGTAQFPNPALPESEKMKETFCVGIDRNGEEIRYAEQRYNPYTTNVVSLKWETVSQDQLYQRLQQLSPVNDPLLRAMKREEAEIRKRIATLDEQNRIKREMEKIREQQARDAAVMNQLLEFVSRCGASPESQDPQIVPFQ